jgi:hypothetical protein
MVNRILIEWDSENRDFISLNSDSVVFILFAYSFFKPRTSRDWRSFGAFSAFRVTFHPRFQSQGRRCVVAMRVLLQGATAPAASTASANFTA